MAKAGEVHPVSTPETTVDHAIADRLKPLNLLRPPGRTAMLLTLSTLLCVILFAAPRLQALYRLEQAGAAVERAVRWPHPRLADSLPQLTDARWAVEAEQALARVLEQASAPAYGYHLRATLLLAHGDLFAAAQDCEHARRLEPQNVLYAWECGRIYEEMQHQIDRATTLPLHTLFFNGEPASIAPGGVDPACPEVRRCLVGEKLLRMPYAALPEGAPDADRVALIVFPLAQVSQSIQLPPQEAALSFLLGHDPAAYSGSSDGATLRVLVSQGGQPAAEAYSRTLDRATSLQGWVADWADLSRWAGQHVTITLELQPGPAQNPADDWYGWADLVLTSPSAARYSTLLPRQQMLLSWQAARLSPAAMVSRGDEARKVKGWKEALGWYQRALLLDPSFAPAWYHQGLAKQALGDGQAARAAYEQALQHNPRLYPPYVALARLLWQQGEREGAKALATQASELEPKIKDAYLLLGTWAMQEQDVKVAQMLFTHVLTLDPQDKQAQTALKTLNKKS